MATNNFGPITHFLATGVDMKAWSSEKGFTIIETMVAIVILGVGMLAVGTMLLTSMSADKVSAQTKSAESVALQKIEDLKTQATSFPLSTTTYSSADSIYAYKWIVSNYLWLDTKQKSGLKQLDITLGWPVGGLCSSTTPENCQRTFSVTTYFTPVTP